MVTEDYKKGYSEAMEDIGLSVIQMSDFVRDFTEIRYRMSRGDSFLLTHNSKAIAFMRQLTEQDLIEDENSDEEDMEIWGIEEVRTNRDEFLYTMKDGRAITLGYRNKTLAIITPEIPQEYRERYEEAWKQFSSTDRKKRREKR